MNRIVLVSTYCDLDTNTNNRFTSICDMINKKNFSVELITSSFNHTKKKQKSSVANRDYKVTYIKDIGYKKNVSVRRILSIALLSLRLKNYLNHIHPDVLYCAAPPIGVAKVVLNYCRRCGIPMILDVQDLWPEAFEMVLKNRFVSIIYALLKRRIDRIYFNSTEVFTVSDTYSDRVRMARKNGTVHTVYLGIDMKPYEDTIVRLHNRNNERLKIVYIGTLGHSYDIPNFLYAIDKLNRDAHLLDVIIIGDGPKMDDFVDIKTRLELTNVHFVGRKPYYEMAEIIKDCDIAINPIVKGAAQSVINKVCDYAAAGLPVVNSQENEEYRELLIKYDAGVNVECENSDSMYKGIKELICDGNRRRKLSINSRMMAEQLFDRRITYKKMINLLENI